MNSKMVLDELRAEKLLGRGDLLCNAGCGLVRVLGSLIGVFETLSDVERVRA